MDIDLEDLPPLKPVVVSPREPVPDRVEAARPVQAEFAAVLAPRAAEAVPAVDIAAEAQRQHAAHRHRADRDAMLAQMAAARAARRWTRVGSLVLLTGCGQGLAACVGLPIDGRSLVPLLIAVACAVVAWRLLRWARLPAEQLEGLPIPAPEGEVPQDPSEEVRLQQLHRRRQDLRRINDTVREMDFRMSCLRFALVTAAGGCLLGWMIGFFVNLPAFLLAGAVGASMAALVGWQLRRERWSGPQAMGIGALAIPGPAALAAYLCGPYGQRVVSVWLLAVLAVVAIMHFVAIQAQLAEENSVQRAA